MNNSLESHRFFPIIAWVLVVGFALFTYSLTIRMNKELGSIDSNISDLEARIEKLEKNTP